ncbi:intraflagellar transport protein 43 homolog A isoform X1 [Ixodes scapularis]
MDAEDLRLDSPVKKPIIPTRSRRSNLFSSSSSDAPSNATTRDGDLSKPPLRPRRMSGWADESSSGFFRSRRPSAQPQSTLKTETPKVASNETVLERDDSDSDMPTIPDLGEVDHEDLTDQIAQAPSAPIGQMDAFRHLDSELLKQAAFATLDGCDLRLLAKHLSPEEDLREVWSGNRAIKRSSFGRATLGVLFCSRTWLGPGTSCSRRSPPKSTRATSRRAKTTELAPTLFPEYLLASRDQKDGLCCGTDQ